MADRAQPLGRAATAVAAAAVMLVLALTLGTLGAVLAHAGGAAALGPADWAALRFTLAQATASAVISLALAIPLARALARRRFAGRGLLITLMGAPFILPVIVAVLGLLAIFGRAGPLNDGLAALGLPRLSIYGPAGVVLAHVFLNLPLALRLLLQGWAAIPAERFRLALALGFARRDIARHVEAPMLRAHAPGILAAIFLICLTSFAVALTLGGGPRATTLELAIYQAFRFDYAPGRAATLAALQSALCLVAAGVAARMSGPAGQGAGLDRVMRQHGAGGAGLRILDAALIGLAALFLLAPLGAVLAAGLPRLLQLPAPVWAAAARSLAVALAAMLLALGLALPLALAAAAGPNARRIETLAMLPLATSALVIGTGLFLMLRPFVRPGDLALPVTALVNAVLALPFCLRALLPAARAIEADYGRLAASLGLAGMARFRLLTLPRLARPLRFAAGLAAALAMGDLGVVALFADAGNATLPLQVYRLMGAYRTADAAGAALLLVLISLALFRAFDRAGRDDADT